jgi:hypothetical protein
MGLVRPLIFIGVTTLLAGCGTPDKEIVAEYCRLVASSERAQRVCEIETTWAWRFRERRYVPAPWTMRAGLEAPLPKAPRKSRLTHPAEYYAWVDAKVLDVSLEACHARKQRVILLDEEGNSVAEREECIAFARGSAADGK